MKMEAGEIYEELNKQLETISNRLGIIEGKIDLQVERDHNHELKIQRLEMSIENMTREISELKTTIQNLKENSKGDIKSLGDRIHIIENMPDKKKAGIVNTILERALNYFIGIVLAAIAAYLAVMFGKNK
jgi:chromosome segregation ATPase